MGGVWEEPNVEDCTCPGQSHHYIRCITLMWSSTPVGETAVLSCPNTDGNATRRLY